MKKHFSLFIFLFTFNFFSVKAQQKTDSVSLKDWKFTDCDNTFDPYKLKARISSFDRIGPKTIININFADNCCIDPMPLIEFKNDTLFISTNDQAEDHCMCNCCFGLELNISGLPDQKIPVKFDKQFITQSIHPYEVKEPTFQIYKGQKINQRNLYGFQIGYWIEFNKDSSISGEFLYPSQSISNYSMPIWEKHYAEEGYLRKYVKNSLIADTTENYNVQGICTFAYYELRKKDTLRKLRIERYDNGQTKLIDDELEYEAEIITKKGNKTTVDMSTTITDEKYYENGQLKEQLKNDTTFHWSENGTLKKKVFYNGTLLYDTTGVATHYHFEWHSDDWKTEYNLSAYIHKKGYIYKVEYEILKEEESDDWGVDATVSSQKHSWTFNKKGKTKTSPENWEGDLPWKKFPSLKL